MKSKTSKRKAVKSRDTLAAIIRTETNIRRKWEIARGQSLYVETLPVGDRDYLRLIEVWQRHALYLSKHPTPDADPTPHLKGFHEYMHKMIEGERRHLGELLSNAMMQNEHGVFSRIATLMQYEKAPEPHEQYEAALNFCCSRDCGTKDNPADGKQLFRFMKAQGHYFNGYYENTVPDGLRNLCKRLGIVLAQPDA